MEYSLLPISLTNIIDPTIFQDEIKSFFLENSNRRIPPFLILKSIERRREFSPWITTRGRIRAGRIGSRPQMDADNSYGSDRYTRNRGHGQSRGMPGTGVGVKIHARINYRDVRREEDRRPRGCAIVDDGRAHACARSKRRDKLSGSRSRR